MGKKKKPVKGLKSINEAVYPSDAVIEAIKEKSGIPFNDDYTRKLRSACSYYFHDKKVLNRLPRPSQVKVALEDIIKKANDLKECLENTDFVSTGKLSPRLPYRIYDLCNDLKSLSLSSEEVIESLPNDKGGASKDYALDLLIEKLAFIFKDATSTIPSITKNNHSDGDKYQGKFYSFVATCIEQIDPETARYQTNNGLGQRIENITKRLKKTDFSR